MGIIILAIIVLCVIGLYVFAVCLMRAVGTGFLGIAVMWAVMTIFFAVAISDIEREKGRSISNLTMELIQR